MHVSLAIACSESPGVRRIANENIAIAYNFQIVFILISPLTVVIAGSSAPYEILRDSEILFGSAPDILIFERFFQTKPPENGMPGWPILFQFFYP
jgi:methyl coenzyme M reductase subunit C